MRFADVFRLALGALWRQKARTLLTTLGVVFGSFALVISLSIGQGVQAAILHEASRYGDLRKIIVHPGRLTTKREPPTEEVEVRGAFSAERRKRLHEALVRRWQQRQPFRPGKALGTKEVRELAALDHVLSVTPNTLRSVKVALGDKTQFGELQTVQPDSPALEKLLFAGQLFSSNQAREVIASELLLYQLGVSDEEGMKQAIGKTVRITFAPRLPTPQLLFTLLGTVGPAELTAKDEKLLAEAVSRLPQAMKNLDLTAEQKSALDRLLKSSKRTDGVSPPLDLTIRGVVELAPTNSMLGFSIYDSLRGDLFLPSGTAEDLFTRLPEFGAHGHDWIVLEIDAMENVKEVTQQIKELGLFPDSLAARIEHERFMYLLIFGGMTVVAGVALLVAALGIANTMLISVLERVREIGVMKAIGAKNRHVQMIFLVEGAVIGLLGGLIGLLLAIGVSGPCDAWVRSMVASGTTIKLDRSIFLFPVWLLVLAPIFACLVTTLAAVYPARRAARVDPVTALRHE